MINTEMFLITMLYSSVVLLVVTHLLAIGDPGVIVVELGQIQYMSLRMLGLIAGSGVFPMLLWLWLVLELWPVSNMLTLASHWVSCLFPYIPSTVDLSFDELRDFVAHLIKWKQS